MVKDALGAVDPTALVAYRFLLAALVLLPWALRKRNPWRLLKKSAILSVILATLYLSQTIGLRHTSAANSGFITGLFVIFVPALLLVFFKKPPTPAQWAAALLALAGLWLVTGGAGSFNKGDGLTIFCAAAYAAHLLATDVYVRGDADTVLLAFHQFWMTGVLSLLAAAVLRAPLGVATPKAGVVIVFLALVPTLSAFYVQMLAQRVVAPVKVSLILTLEPVFAALFAWTLGGEAFRPGCAAGGALIVLAMMMGSLFR